MSDAAQEHLQAVKAAHANAQELGAAMEHLQTGIEEAAAAVATLDTALERAQGAYSAAERTQSAANAAHTTGEAHVTSARQTGHSTLQLAIDANEHSYSAALSASAVLDQIGTLQALLAQVREAIAAPLAATGSQAEEAIGGIAVINGALDEADAQIQQAINA